MQNGNDSRTAGSIYGFDTKLILYAAKLVALYQQVCKAGCSY